MDQTEQDSRKVRDKEGGGEGKNKILYEPAHILVPESNNLNLLHLFFVKFGLLTEPVIGV